MWAVSMWVVCLSLQFGSQPVDLRMKATLVNGYTIITGLLNCTVWWGHVLYLAEKLLVLVEKKTEAEAVKQKCSMSHTIAERAAIE